MSQLREALKWQEEAACNGGDLHTFFLEELYPEAKAICGSCPVRETCLEQNMQERHGVFGGLDENERKQLGGASAPYYTPSFHVNDSGRLVDEGIPDPDEKSEFTKLRFDPNTPDGEVRIRRMLDLYAKGKLTIAEIAVEVDVSDKTVRHYVKKHGKQRTYDEAMAARRKNMQEVRDAAVELYKQGFGFKTVANELAVSPSTVRSAVLEAGVTPRGPGPNPDSVKRMSKTRGFPDEEIKKRLAAKEKRAEVQRAKDQAQQAEIIRLYVTEGLGIKKIAALLHSSHTRIRRILTEANVEVMSISDPRAVERMKQARWGKKDATPFT